MRSHIRFGRAVIAGVLTAVVGLAAGCPAALASSTSVGSGGYAPQYRVADPLLLNGQPIPCPDPDAVQVSSRPYTVDVACTSDRNEGDVNGSAFALYRTNDLRDLTRDGWIFPPGHEPWWANASPRGQFWAPTIMHIGGNWIAYFGAEVNQTASPLSLTGIPGYQMAIGVAWGPTLHTMWTHTAILHYARQFNAVPGNAQETDNGLIDPSVAYDPVTHTLYIAYVNQPDDIMLGTLAPNGLAMHRKVTLISAATFGWEGLDVDFPVEEGPVLIWNSTLRAMTAIVNTDDTWTGSYKEGFLVSFNPASGVFYKFDRPIFHSGNGLIGPGMGSKPLTGPDGTTQWVYMHEQLQPAPDPTDPEEMQRYLMLEPYQPVGKATMLVPLVPGDLTPTVPGYMVQNALGSFIRVPVPQIGTGETQPSIVTPFLATAPATHG